MRTQDEQNFNNLHNLLTVHVTVKEAKQILAEGIDFDAVISTNMNSYTPIKSDYIDALMTAFFYLHHLNSTSSASRWVSCGNWRQQLRRFKPETAELIENFMEDIKDV